MAPKALTDCPENLREAIDWLVQVQHWGGVSTVSDALSTLFDNVAQDAEKSLPSLPDPDQPSARDVVSKLRAFQSTLPKDSANPNKNIIHNLCTSAGNLLGYRYPGTYDGSGIVYGNASRLCDAILAFLYAVFSDVHDNQPYVAGRDVLRDDVIVQLKFQLWRGHKGFCQAIPKVATGLQRYNSAVKASNDRVKEPIETVLDYVKPGGELCRGINDLQITETSTPAEDEQTVESAVSLVEKCKEVAKVFSKSLTAAKDAIDDLNPKLKRKLDNARRSFFNHVDWLSRWSKKGQKKRLDKMVQKIKSRLKQLAKAVKYKIKREVHMLVELLKDRVREIKMKLEGITASLEKYVKELGTWMDEAKKYIQDVKKYVNDIMDQLDGEHKKAIDKTAAEIDSELGKKVEELATWIEDAEAAVTVAKQKAEDVFKRLEHSNADDPDGTKIAKGIKQISTAKDKVSGVNTQLETVHSDLGDWKGVALDELRKAAEKVGEVSGQLDPSKQGDGHTIGDNLNQIGTSNEDIKKANDQLKTQVDKLSNWITDADGLRQKAQDKAQEVYNSLKVHEQLSDKIKDIQVANQTIKDASSGLGDVEKSLEGWNQEAGRVIQGVVEKAKEVYEKLNHGDDDQPIGKGIKYIKDARAKVEEVDKRLQAVNEDLEKWRKAAETVLTSAVDKASEVHKALDPTNNTSTLGGQIDAIDTARQGIVTANEQLGEQVKSLNEWIESAERIRAAAETKAKEAYDKLSVHEKLSENVNKILDANKVIREVHTKVGEQVQELGTWNDQAKKVIQGAVTKATQVHDALKDDVYKQIDKIERDNKEIMSASKSLEEEVGHLGNWKDAAGKVIAKAENKCDEILRRVDKNHKDNEGGKKGPVILQEASNLKEHGQKLLTAASEAKQKVEEKVKDALDAVKAMDSDLKRDLYDVKRKIKEGITEVIKNSGVDQLGEEVQKDLKVLRERISDLSKGLAKDGKYNPIVEKALHDLEQANRRITVETNKIKTETEQKLVEKFNSDIQKPLAEKVTAVERAIGELYKTVNPTDSVLEEDKKKLQPIFEHIKRQVADIKGSGKKENESGIDGIVAHVRRLYDAFVDGNNSGVGARVDGWIGNILGINENQRGTQTDGMKAVTSWIKEYNGKARRLEDALKIVKHQIKNALSSEINTGQRRITRVDAEDNIVQNLRKVKDACEAFVEALDKKLTNTQIDNFVQNIVTETPSSSASGSQGNNADNLKTAAVKAALIALCSCVRQVAAEVQFLGISMFGEKIDAIKPTVDDLHSKLGNATNALTPGEATLGTGTAQAVDKAIEGVKDMVGSTIKEKFESDVKQPVETAVQGLEKAVSEYDKQAKEQVREAAKTAIEQSAKEISAKENVERLDVKTKMKNFHNAHQRINNELENDLKQNVEEQLPSRSHNIDLIKTTGFKRYDEHVSTGVLTHFPHGKLAGAIGKIDGEGLKEINKHIGKHAEERIRDNTFIHPIYEIRQQLEEITNLVNNEGKGFMGEGYTPTSKGVKTLLTDLTKALGDGKLDGINEGLAEIKTVIEKLQKDTFGLKAEAIRKAVEEMRKEVEELKRKLKSEDDNDDVINALKELKDTGLASVTWNGKDGRQVGGLQKIESELQTEMKTLKDPPGIIDKAIRKIKFELVKIGFNLSNGLVPDDILDQLDTLREKIGIRKATDGSLHQIHNLISGLWVKQFSGKPKVIHGAAGAIKGELSRLRHVLDNDVADTMKNLQTKGLGSVNWDKVDHRKGLEVIEKELTSQQSKVNAQPNEMKSGVDLITKQLDSLRTALQNSNGDPTDDVVKRLENLINDGLGKDRQWNGKDGLGKIRSNLHQQNERLAQQYKTIENATETVLKETEDVLKKIRQKLSPDLVPYDNIASYLQELNEKIGKEKDKNDSLQGILREISSLQAGPFDEKSKGIGEAKLKVEHELTRLKGELVTHVADPLKALMEQGLGDDKNWNGKKAKGFDTINHHLQRQQQTLSQQPKDMQDGINEITGELQILRTELHGTDSKNPQERGAIRNLQFMIKHIGGSDREGLKKIKSGMESLKSQVPVITSNLNAMSTEITNAAGQLGLNLNQLENPHIDVKLKGIKDGLTNLRLTDLADAIKLCDDFLDKADEIEKNTVDALLKHVDYEVGDVIRDLTKEARQHYVDSVREALELFAKKVNEDLEQLPGDINHDLTIGFKGFMNTVEGENSVNINKLKRVRSRELKLLSAAFGDFFGTVNDYVRKETQRVHDEQNKERNPSLPPTEEPYTPKLNDVYEALTELLVYLRDNDGGTDRLTELVERLAKTLSNLVPSDFKHSSTPLLDTVSCGLTKFACEFGNTYISTYSGQRCREEHSHKYAKVLLSLIPMTHQDLTKLATKCAGDWKHLHISNFTAEDMDNPLGNYLTRCGYRVSSNESGQHGELNHMFTGAGIKELLTTPIPDVAVKMHVDGEPLENGNNLVHILSLLYDLLCHYFQACHIPVPPDPRCPCTVRDMLSWLSGLQYTQVADKLPEHCKALLNRRCHEGDTPNKEDAVMAKCIGELPSTIATTCSHSTALLTAIQGNGHGFDLAAYQYSVDFSNNRARLHYPSDPDALLDILRDIVCRLCKVLYFLYSQCCRSTARVKGWRECAYGRQVQSHHWQCNTFNVQSAASATTTATATTSSTTATHGCPPTSPLQSFLSDSCQGLLPHTLTAADMVIECANCTANPLGQQCLTPLGFWDLGFAASISGTGWDLAKRLGDMCRDADSCLFVLCRTLSLLCPAAPSSLADLFVFYSQVLRQWDTHDRVRNRGGTYTDASDFISHLNTDGIDSLFPLWTQLHGSYENSKLTSAIASLADHGHKSHDALSSLFYDSTCKSPSGCAPYLQPLGLHAHHTYPRKHAGLYITWIMYLAWQFWELLCDLLHALDNIDCTVSGCATCPCQPGTHGGKDACHCPSIVQCAGPLPTLYRYGFTYRNANMLVTDNPTVRCGDLNTQLKEALHSDHFTELFRQIDQLIWHIRMPFVYFLIALWSLVALYILHTFLYRMDILHIRSHLIRTKASHVIDVKALLTDGKKMTSLYDANYFDDDPAELLNLRY